MNILASAALAFSMFSRIPMPKVSWNEKNMRYMLACFPLVGLLVWVLMYAWITMCFRFGVGRTLLSAGALILPLAVTGAVHMDGFCDTIDALSAHADKKRSREILKDPHIGTFAVVGVCGYMILDFALFRSLELGFGQIMLIGIGYVISRAFSGLASVMFKGGSDGTLRGFSMSANKRPTVVMLCLFIVVPVGIGFYFSPACAALMLLLDVLCLVWLYFTARDRFGEMRGDLAGCFLQICEILTLIALLICQKGGLV